MTLWKYISGGWFRDAETPTGEKARMIRAEELVNDTVHRVVELETDLDNCCATLKFSEGERVKAEAKLARARDALKDLGGALFNNEDLGSFNPKTGKWTQPLTTEIKPGVHRVNESTSLFVVEKEADKRVGDVMANRPAPSAERHCRDCGRLEDASNELDSYRRCTDEHKCKGWLPPEEVERRVAAARDEALEEAASQLERSGRFLSRAASLPDYEGTEVSPATKHEWMEQSANLHRSATTIRALKGKKP